MYSSIIIILSQAELDDVAADQPVTNVLDGTHETDPDNDPCEYGTDLPEPTRKAYYK
jgi:hypothetical protein